MTEPELQYGSVNFFVYLSNNFEQVPVPGVTENRYLTVRLTRGWLSEGRNLHRVCTPRFPHTLINVAGRHRYLTFLAGPWFGQKSKT